MSWEESPKDVEVYQQALDAELAAGTERRIAEGRARSKAIRSYRAANPEEAAKHAAAARAPGAAAAAAPAAAAAAPSRGRAPRPVLPSPWPRRR